MHLTETVEVVELDEAEITERSKDHIAELQQETGNVVRLHSIP
jgi:hypothetical protein